MAQQLAGGSVDWPQRLHRSALRATSGTEPLPALAVVVVLLAASTALLVAAGGTDHAPPHWFYVPIVFAALRFGPGGAAVTGLASGMLVGEVPADVSTGVAQQTSDWMLRTAMFIALGLALPALAAGSTRTVAAERARRRTARSVHRAIAEQEFLLHYQPIRSVRSGRIVGLEALLRWQHPTRGLLLPKDFLEDLAPVGTLSSWVLETACRQVATWQRQLELPRLMVSVNVPADRLGEPDFAVQVQQAIAAGGIDPHCVCLEITEQALIDDLPAAAERLEVLRALGVAVAIDDFGTGHAGLSYLQDLPLDVIKIDRSFVMKVTAHPRSDSIIQAVVELAVALEATSVAEGIETPEQLEAVRRLGCPMVQGYLTGRPAHPDVIEQALQDPAVPPARLAQRT